MIRQSERKCWRVKSASARVLILQVGGFENSAEESAMFDSTRRVATTSCAGFLAGQRFERTAGTADTDCKGARYKGPSVLY